MVAGAGEQELLFGFSTTEPNAFIESSFYWSETADVAVCDVEDVSFDVECVENKISNEDLVAFLNNNISKENKSEWKKWKMGDKGYPVFED